MSCGDRLHTGLGTYASCLAVKRAPHCCPPGQHRVADLQEATDDDLAAEDRAAKRGEERVLSKARAQRKRRELQRQVCRQSTERAAVPDRYYRVAALL